MGLVGARKMVIVKSILRYYAWILIYERLKRVGKLDVLLDLQPPKNWQSSRDGGPRRIVRKDLRLIELED